MDICYKELYVYEYIIFRYMYICTFVRFVYIFQIYTLIEKNFTLTFLLKSTIKINKCFNVNIINFIILVFASLKKMFENYLKCF